MRLVIPVSASDQHLLEVFVQALARYRGLEQHHVFLVPTPSQYQLASEALDELISLCPQSKMVPLDTEVSQHGWPYSSNKHFVGAARLILREPDQMPWFWMELDCFPCREGWLDALSIAIQSAGGAQFMGRKVDARVKGIAGKAFQLPGDKMMMGTAIYPHRLAEMPLFGPMFISMELNPGQAPKEPFDFWLRHAFAREGVADTDLIADEWNTVNYRIEGNQLVCDAGEAREDAPNARKRGGPVDQRAVVVHGCKDGSGHLLAAQGKIPRHVLQATPGAPKRVFSLGNGQAQDGGDVMSMFAQMQRENQEFQMRMMTMIAQMSTGHPVTMQPQTPPPEESIQVENSESMSELSAAIESDVPLVDRIYVSLNGASKSLKKVALDLGVDKSTARSMIGKHPEFEIGKAPAGWVTAKVPQETAA